MPSLKGVWGIRYVHIVAVGIKIPLSDGNDAVMLIKVMLLAISISPVGAFFIVFYPPDNKTLAFSFRSDNPVIYITRTEFQCVFSCSMRFQPAIREFNTMYAMTGLEPVPFAIREKPLFYIIPGFHDSHIGIVGNS